MQNIPFLLHFSPIEINDRLCSLSVFTVLNLMNVTIIFLLFSSDERCREACRRAIPHRYCERSVQGQGTF
jgi:hypothetical protein